MAVPKDTGHWFTIHGSPAAAATACLDFAAGRRPEQLPAMRVLIERQARPVTSDTVLAALRAANEARPAGKRVDPEGLRVGYCGGQLQGGVYLIEGLEVRT
jgi:hypothetical protein